MPVAAATDGAEAVGGIINTGNLTLQDSTITGTAQGGAVGDGGYGGGYMYMDLGGDRRQRRRRWFDHGGRKIPRVTTVARAVTAVMGGDGGAGGDGGDGGSAVGGIVNAGAVTIVGAAALGGDSATAGGGGTPGAGGYGGVFTNNAGYGGGAE